MVHEFLNGGNKSIQQLETTNSSHIGVVGQQFLRFQLSGETMALLPVNQMTEVLNIPVNQIVPIPHMPAWVMGVFNWRGEILWITDLGHLVGLSPLYQQTISRLSYTAIVIHSAVQVHGRQKVGSQVNGKRMLGLVVDRVEDMEWCDPDSIQSPPQSAVTAELVPFLRGYWMKPTGEMLVVLDGESIMQRMPNSPV